MNLLERITAVSANINRCCQLSGRDPESVQLMLVTKTVPIETIIEAHQLGNHLFGENKVQEVVQKWIAHPEGSLVKPEFIGHLQTNKVKTCLDVCSRIQSVDRLSLVEALDRELQKRGEQREIFLQVNSSDEASKFGLSVEETLPFAQTIQRYQTLKVTGLMTLALFSQDEHKVRPCFKKLKHLFTQVQDTGLFGEDFQHLSMGMSSDYQIAITEGATLVRVGTAIFGARSTPDSHYWPDL